MSGLHPARAQAYRTAEYRAAGLSLRIGRHSAALDGLLAGMGVRQAVFITAANPRSRRMPPAWNDRMTAQLRHRLNRFTWYPAESGAGKWRETQFLAALPSAPAARLGRHFRQSALVALRRGQKPRLLVLI